MILVLSLVACGHGDETGLGVDANVCGDLDGPGGDTGDIPNLLGHWTSAFGQVFYDEGICDLSNLSQTSESWIGSGQVDGSVTTNFLLTYDDAPDEQFWGAMDPNGGITFTGQHTHSQGTMYAHFSGLFYHDQYLDRDIIDGAAFLGMDTNGDAVLDCGVKGSWLAYKSGV